MRTGKSTFLGIIVTLTAFLILSAGPLFAEPITLKFANFEPAQAKITTQIFNTWVEEVNKAGQGIIKIDIFSGGVLGRDPGTQLKVILDGIADIAWILNPYTPGRFPDDQVVNIPGVARNNIEAGVALQRLYDKGMLRGYDDIIPIGCTTAYPYYIHSDYPVKIPEDLQGKKFKATGQMQHVLLEAVGGTPVGMSITKVAESVNRGVLSGLLGEPNSMNTFRVYEVVKYHLEKVDFGTSNQMVAMTKKRYNSLPAEARAILDKFRGEAFARYYGDRMNRIQLSALQKYKDDPKHKFYTPSAAETEKWFALMDPLVEKWKETHPNGENLLNTYRTEVEKIRNE